MWCPSITFQSGNCDESFCSSSPARGGTPPLQGTQCFAARPLTPDPPILSIPSIHRAISGQSEQRTINSKFEYCQLTQLKYCEFVRQSTIENDALRLLLRSPTQSMMELETK